MSDYSSDYLTDTEKFAVMASAYIEIFKSSASFAKKIGSAKQTTTNWYNREGKTINARARIKICEVFNLQHTVWTDKFDNEINFLHSLPEYQKVSKPISIDKEKQRQLDIKIVGEGRRLTAEEEDILARLSSGPDLVLASIELKGKTPIFLFELSKIFKDKNQIAEALEIINSLQAGNSTFKYTFHNEIEHFKAVSLSHNQMQKWDEAIDILRLLYSSSHYHLVEPEIITLMASNYKRKALSGISGNGWRDRDDIDVNLLASALSLYGYAYKLKSKEGRYYDAVNMAYLINIINTIEPDEDESLTVSGLYSELTREWRADDESWWEVSSDAEMLMLSDKTNIAISKLNDFFDFNQEAESFEIETTLRQLEMYLHFVDDLQARMFYDHLKESLEYIKL